MNETADEPWSWSEERWRSTIGRVRAGRNLRPKRWKGGARCAIALTFNCDFETAHLTASGGTIQGLSRGHFGARAGTQRLLSILARHKVPGTFFIPAIAAMLHPELVKTIAAAGHEIGLSSWIGEDRQRLSAQAERELLGGARSALEKASGMKPVGFRANGTGVSDATPGILKDMGLAYDSSLSADDDPHELLLGGEPSGLIELPPGPSDMILEDALPGGGATTPEALFDIFRREVEAAYEEGGLVVLSLTPDLIGRRANAWLLHELIKLARTLPGVWIATLADIAGYIKAKSGA